MATNQPAQGTYTSVSASNTSNHTAWQYDNRFLIITHDADACDVCTSWGEHYLMSTLQKDASLQIAKDQWDADIHSDLHTELTGLCSDNNTLSDDLLSVRAELADICTTLKHAEKELDDVNEDLMQVQDQFNDAEHNACHLHDEYNRTDDCTQVTINELHRQICKLEHGQMPRHHKRAHHYSDSRESSPS
jgi:chromosome segregation ATPase